MTGRRPLLSEQSQGSGYPPASSLETPTRQTTTPAVQQGPTHESGLPFPAIREPDSRPYPCSADILDENELYNETCLHPSYSLHQIGDYPFSDNQLSTQDSFSPSSPSFSSTQFTQFLESTNSVEDLPQDHYTTVGSGRRDIDGRNITSSAPAIPAPLVPEASRRKRSQMDQPSESDHDSSNQPSSKQLKLSPPEERIPQEDAEFLTAWLKKNKRDPSVEEKHKLADLTELRFETVCEWFRAYQRRNLTPKECFIVLDWITEKRRLPDKFEQKALADDIRVHIESVRRVVQVVRPPDSSPVEQLSTRLPPTCSTKDLARDYPNYPNDLPANARKALSGKCHEPVDPVPSFSGVYYCLSCPFRTSRHADFERHLNINYPQWLWWCSRCQDLQVPKRCFYKRHDKFMAHIKTKHKGVDPAAIINASLVEGFIAVYETYCGFCHHSCTSFRDYVDHIASYQDGTMKGAEGRKCGKENWHRQLEDNEGATEAAAELDRNYIRHCHDRSNPRGGPGSAGSGSGAGSGFGSGSGSGATGGGTNGSTDQSSEGRSQQSRGSSYNGYYHANSVDLQPQDDFAWPVEQPRYRRIRECGQQHDTRSVDTKYLDKKPSDIDLNRHRDPLIDQRIQPNDGSDNDDNFDPRPDGSPERCGISNSGSDIIRSQRVDDRVTHRTFHHVCRLGIGAHGTVDKVQHQLTRELFARKTLRRSHKHPSNITQPSQELEIMIKLKHPNIVEVFAAYFEQSTLNVIMRPVAELNLKEYLNAPQRWPENTQHLGSWLSSLASGLSYIHARNVIHADLKPSNILISSSQAYIADFGTSREFNDDESTTSSICPMTPMYAAPEIVAHQRHGKSADVFSLGCTFAEMITVMAGSSIANLHLHLSKGQNPKRHPGTYSQCLPALRAWMNHLHTCISKPGFWQLTRLCMSMLQKELKARPSARCLVAQLELFSSDRVGTSDIALQIPENILSLRTTVDCPFLRDQRSPQPFKEPVDASSIPEPDQSPGEDYFGVWLSAVSTASFPAYPDLDLIGLGSQMKTAASFPATKTEILNLRPNCLPCALEDDPAFEAADPGYSFTLLDCVSSGIGEFDLRDVDPRADVSRPWWCSLRWASLMRQQQPMQRIECLPHGSTDEELSEFVMFSMKIITPDFTLFGITVTMYDYCARLFKQSGHEQGRCDQNTGTPSVMNSEFHHTVDAVKRTYAVLGQENWARTDSWPSKTHAVEQASPPNLLASHQKHKTSRIRAPSGQYQNSHWSPHTTLE